MEKRILLLLAHPDDETFGPGGTVARYADEGAAVHLAAATRGEAGMLGDPPVTDRERVGDVRAAELGEAARILGIREVTFLGFPDGGLPEVPRGDLLGQAVLAIRRIRPHVLIGFGPEGVSGHPDHQVMCAVALEAYDAAADPDRFPMQLGKGLRPWAPAKLYQFEIAREIFDRWGVPLAGVPRAAITTTVDTSPYVERKIEAFHAHRTQKKDSARILSRPGYREFCRVETFVLARSRFPAALPETDLFEGIPSGEFRKP